MEQNLCVIPAFLLFVCCHGLDLTMNRESPITSGARNIKICGVLTCTDGTDASDPDTTDKTPKHQTDSMVVLKSISSMSVFERVFTGSSGNAKNRRDVLVGSVTSTTPTLTRVANGRRVEAVLDSERATMRIEFVKQDDCEAEFTCQVRGLDTRGREVVRSTSLVQQSGLAENHVDDKSLMQTISLQLLTSLQQLITQQKSMDVKLSQLQKSMDVKFSQLQRDLIDRSGALENTIKDKMLQLQGDWNDKTDSLENRIEDRIGDLQRDFQARTDIFENRIEDKIDNNNNLNKLMQLDFKVSTELAQFRSEAKADIIDSLDTMRQKLNAQQREALRNVSDCFERALNNTSILLHSVESDFDLLKALDQKHVVDVKNQTDIIREMLTSGEVSATCMVNDTAETNKVTICHRYMDYKRDASYPAYVKVLDDTIQQYILCDTKTLGGGWIVIQRRTSGAEDFYRDWAAYKHGFGAAPGDFWLGNEAIHQLTVNDPYELRIDVRVKNKDFFAQYTSFKVEAEPDNYRLRLGSYSGTIGEKTNFGLSYHNNQQFSTRDRDNDPGSRNCAATYHGGWWYNSCHRANLNGLWRLQNSSGMQWNSGSAYIFPTYTEIKIRRLARH